LKSSYIKIFNGFTFYRSRKVFKNMKKKDLNIQGKLSQKGGE